LSILHLKHDRALMKATLLIERSGENDLFTIRSIQDVLAASGIVAGIEEAVIAEMVENQWFGNEIVVAEGKPAEHGENGRIEYLFDPDPKITPTILPDGSVDYASINILQKVVVGQLLAKLVPPTEGTEGFDLTGTILPAIPGKVAHLGRGMNTSYADGAGTTLKSDVNGHVRLNKDRLIEVATVYEVKGDVNYTIGSIDFEGDVVILGDVLSGFKVIATGEIEVRGVVEDAELRAGGNVLVRAGFIGSGKGHIIAGGNASARYVHHQRITAANDIVIATEAMDATLVAGNCIMVKGTPGVLVGGVSTAGQTIECNQLGNNRSPRTEIALLYESDEGRALESQKELILRTEEQHRKVKVTIERMEEFDQFVSRIRPERSETYEVLYATKADLVFKLERLNISVAELEKKLQDELSALTINVHKAVYPGVNIGIAGTRLTIFEYLGKTQFKLCDGQVTPGELKG